MVSVTTAPPWAGVCDTWYSAEFDTGARMPEGRSLVTPDQAVRDWLRKMGEVSTAMSAEEAAGGAGLTHPPSPPALSSMRILKRRETSGRQVHALAYEDAAGSPWFWIIRLIEDDIGSWRVCGGGGGNGSPEGDPQLPFAWINFAGCWGRDGLALGGRVLGAGTEQAASARLSIRDTVLIDDVDTGIALFVTSEPTEGSRATIELLARDQSVLWRDDFELDE
jgi:hypothetical protein